MDVGGEGGGRRGSKTAYHKVSWLYKLAPNELGCAGHPGAPPHQHLQVCGPCPILHARWQCLRGQSTKTGRPLFIVLCCRSSASHFCGCLLHCQVCSMFASGFGLHVPDLSASLLTRGTCPPLVRLCVRVKKRAFLRESGPACTPGGSKFGQTGTEWPLSGIIARLKFHHFIKL